MYLTVCFICTLPNADSFHISSSTPTLLEIILSGYGKLLGNSIGFPSMMISGLFEGFLWVYLQSNLKIAPVIILSNV